MNKTSEGQHELRGAFERMAALELEGIEAHERAALRHDEAADLLDQAASAQQNRDSRAELMGGAARERGYAAAARARGCTARARLAAEGQDGGARSSTF